MCERNRIQDRVILIAALLAIALAVPAFCMAQDPDAEFRRLASQLATVRLAGGDDDPALLEKALALLDVRILNALSAGPPPDLDALNRSLTALTTDIFPVGQTFRLSRIAATPPVYALAANFGLAGPSAVRIYAAVAGGYALAARIDRSAQKNFFDEYLELVPFAAPAVVFVTITGRTDDLQTGSFAAWHFTGRAIEMVWSADLLQQSSYEAAPNGFHLTYCSVTDDRNPRQCRRMTRNRFLWDAGGWKRVEQTPVPVSKR